MHAPTGSSTSLISEDSPNLHEPPEFDLRDTFDHRDPHRFVDGLPANDSTANGSPSQSKIPLPVQKRQRVTRACDECRRKKIKCDGKQPCTHCTVYSYACTYDQPSNRRRNPGHQYIEAVEARLHKAEAILQALLPNLDLDDPRIDTCTVSDLLSHFKKDRNDRTPGESTQPSPDSTGVPDDREPADESLLESMVDHSGALDLDDQGHWDYHGHSSGLMFMRRLKKQFGNIGPEPAPKFPPSYSLLESKSCSESPADSEASALADLPSRELALELCRHAVEEACAVFCFLHKPTFYAMFNRIYEIPSDQYTNKEHTFLPLLYLSLAVGCLFGDYAFDKSGYKSATDQGYQFYRAGRQLLDVTECRDLTSLQSICMMVVFLQNSANISTCYSYVGIALRAAVRLGLHRSIPQKFNPVEQETRKRVFWMVRKLDVHISVILGLPSMLVDDDIDQEYPLEVDDEFITPTAILPMPPNYTPLMSGILAHLRLGRIMTKVTKYVYPVKTADIGSNHSYMVRHSKIREIESDLQAWFLALPDTFKPGGDTKPEIERLRQGLRVAYAHVQMNMYRPFLHYVTGGPLDRDVDKRSYACAAACVSVARNVVHITAGMKKKRLLDGSFWFTMHTTYFAILTLLFFIFENPDSTTARDGILKDALEGKNVLGGLAKNSLAADRCAQSLNSLFKHLPEKLGNKRSSQLINRKRSLAFGPSSDKAAFRKASADDTRSMHIQKAKTLSANDLSNGTYATESHPQGLKKDDNNAFNLTHSFLPNESVQLNSLRTSGLPLSSNDGMSPLSAVSLPNFPTQQPKQPSLNLHLDNSNYIPDLMPMMFPSDDPFAYPTQPLSTLEDDHFKFEVPDKTGFNFNLSETTGPGMAKTVQSDPVTPAFDLADLNSIPVNGIANHIKKVPLPPEHSNVTMPPTSTAMHSSNSQPPSHIKSQPSPLGDPFLWASQDNNPSTLLSHAEHQEPPQPKGASPTLLEDSQDFAMGMGIGMTNYGGLGMGMDMSGNLDEILNNGLNNDAESPLEWNQWVNTGA